MDNPYCVSLARFVGQWLAQHCSPEGTAEALATMTEERVQAFLELEDPSATDDVFDGSSRVIARCAPEPWNRLFGSYAHLEMLGPHHRPTLATEASP